MKTKTQFYKAVPKVLKLEETFLEYLEGLHFICRQRKEKAIYARAIKAQRVKIKALSELIKFG